MTDLFLLGILAITLFKIKVHTKTFNQNYLDKDSTTNIKGIFVLIVFFSHAVAYAPSLAEHPSVMLAIRDYLGQLMVTMFLFYSGFGVYESIKHKGSAYLKSFPRHRILRTLLHFDVAVVLFLIINLILGTQSGYGLRATILAFTGWTSIGNSNWYIFAILILYAITFIAFTLAEKPPKTAIVFTWILSILFVCILSLHQPSYFYNTILAFPLGLTYSYYRAAITDRLMHSNRKYLLALALAFITFIAFYPLLPTNHLWFYNIGSMLFAILIVLLSMKIHLRSPILNWFGNNLFWFYILQRIPMTIFEKIGLNTHPYQFLLFTFLATCALAFIFGKLFTFLDAKIFRPRPAKSA